MVWYTTIYMNKDMEYCSVINGLIVTKKDNGLKTFQAISSLMFKTTVEMTVPPNFPNIWKNKISLISVPNNVRRDELFDNLSKTRILADFDLSNATLSHRRYKCKSSCGKFEFSTNVEHYTDRTERFAKQSTNVYCIYISQLSI